MDGFYAGAVVGLQGGVNGLGGNLEPAANFMDGACGSQGLGQFGLQRAKLICGFGLGGEDGCGSATGRGGELTRAVEEGIVQVKDNGFNLRHGPGPSSLAR